MNDAALGRPRAAAQRAARRPGPAAAALAAAGRAALGPVARVLTGVAARRDAVGRGPYRG
jgi:hypothetical protein